MFAVALECGPSPKGLPLALARSWSIASCFDQLHSHRLWRHHSAPPSHRAFLLLSVFFLRVVFCTLFFVLCAFVCQGYRKVKLCCEDVQGTSVLTNFHGMDLTRDKLCSLIKKWQTLIEAQVDVRTTDGYLLRIVSFVFCA